MIRRALRTIALLAPLALAACAGQPEPVANRYDRTSAEIENLARDLTAEVENDVRAVEAGVQNQIDAIVANQANGSAPAAINGAAPAANAAPAGRPRR